MFTELFHSVEDVWAIWFISCALLSVLVYRAFRFQHWRSLTSFMRDERGASYALNYLMTFPFYLITVCWVIQSTMILIVKIGVMHSAHVAARSAVVWRPADPEDDDDGLETAEDKAQSAAAWAMTPYASGLERHEDLIPIWRRFTPRAFKAEIEAFAYDELYRHFAQDSEAQESLAVPEFVRRKFRYASAMTDVTLSDHENRFNEELSATVEFRMPIHIPGAGWVLGSWSSNGFYRDIEATATAIGEAVAMPLDERKARWRAMFDYLCANDVAHWRESFLGEIEPSRPFLLRAAV